MSSVEEAVRFLQQVFGAEADLVEGRPTEVLIGDSVVLVSSTEDRDAFMCFLYIYVDDADSTYQLALQAGAISIERPLDTPYGDRRAMFEDRFGNVYQVAHRLRSDQN